MIEKEVIDNFLPANEFNFIRETIADVSFYWGFIPKSITGEKPQLVHLFCDSIRGFTSGQAQSIMAPLVNKLQPSAVLKAKANLQWQRDTIIEDPLHVDFTGVQATTSILYMNTCNGYTHFEDGSKVHSVANRIVTFPTQTLHAGANCTDDIARVVINFNYHKMEGKDD